MYNMLYDKWEKAASCSREFFISSQKPLISTAASSTASWDIYNDFSFIAKRSAGSV